MFARTGVLGLLVMVAGMLERPAHGQFPGGGESRLGPRPGEGVPSVGGSDAPLQGGLGPGFSRVPSNVTRPAPPTNIPEPPSLHAAAEVPPIELPPYGTLDLAPGGRDDGPSGGLTLDQAIERLVRENLELRSKFQEIPQAQADILTAGLRANPVFFYDTQLIPYGSFSEKRPGGQTQYDLNVTLPLDLNGKRRHRLAVATQARRIIEAQYQDAVRVAIGTLSNAFVDVLAARETIRFTRASIDGLGRILAVTRSLERGGERTPADVAQIQIQRDAAELALAEAMEALQEARRALLPLLNLRIEEAESLELSGSLQNETPPPPPTDVLLQLAMASRPDLASYRLGIDYAQADVRLAQAERFQDVFLLAQPYTYQDNAPFNARSARSWGVGLTVPLPIFDRNQGRIQRARVNVEQTRIDLAAMEQQVAFEVRQAERRYWITKQSVDRIERDLLPAAEQVRENTLRRYRGGEADFVEFLNAQRNYNDLVRQYRDTLTRHRRSMLELNTAVGQRLLP